MIEDIGQWLKLTHWKNTKVKWPNIWVHTDYKLFSPTFRGDKILHSGRIPKKNHFCPFFLSINITGFMSFLFVCCAESPIFLLKFFAQKWKWKKVKKFSSKNHKKILNFANKIIDQKNWKQNWALRNFASVFKA